MIQGQCSLILIHIGSILTLKVPSIYCSRQQLKKCFYFSEKTSLDISCESSAKQTIGMKCQDLFSLKNKKKIKIKLSSAAVVIGALRVYRVGRVFIACFISFSQHIENKCLQLICCDFS